jgi:hypothetical protein
MAKTGFLWDKIFICRRFCLIFCAYKYLLLRRIFSRQAG